MYYPFNGEFFVWNVEKANKNLQKHGVRFVEAVTVFFDPVFILVDTSRSDEARHAAAGFDQTGCLLYVVVYRS
ncbi:BrnT family toxin [Nitrosomonas nitrosa]|uniref:BrnT family toxin n=1 Tax=Nitrosomonas nitrosa TaxID=52442 RepID=UPI001956C375